MTFFLNTSLTVSLTSLSFHHSKARTLWSLLGVLRKHVCVGLGSTHEPADHKVTNSLAIAACHGGVE